MKRMKKRKGKTLPSKSSSLDWLPFESWLVPDIFSFTYVRGAAKFFLLLEISLALAIVIGTLMAVGVKAVSAFL